LVIVLTTEGACLLLFVARIRATTWEVKEERWAERAPIARPGVASDRAVRFFARVMLPIVRLFHRATLEGTEHLPASGPFLLVSNHSGALPMAELLAFMALYAARFGGSRPLAGFVHPISFRVWPLSRLLPHIGAIPSSYAAAEDALAKGVPILVFPGGDHEALRPLWQANRVDFNGRLGFLRIARKARLPIVPMGIRGAHLTAPPLVRSRLLSYLAVWPRLAGVKRWAITVLGVLGATAIVFLVPLAWPWRALLAWAFIASPLSMMTWVPWTVRIRIGPVIAAEALFADGADLELERALPIVEQAVQRLVAK
jgi:1-acyl-sn-glycerol-3-phosphate acyltransferase